MQKRIKDMLVEAEADQIVVVKGWVKSKRVAKSCAFLMINDGSVQNDLQLIVDPTIEDYNKLSSISTGSPIEVSGVIRQSMGKGQAWEVGVDTLKVFGDLPSEEYPLQKKGHTLEFLRELNHLKGRTNTFGAVFRIRNQLSNLVHEFFQSKGFLWAHTPILSANDCEGAGELFQVSTLDMEKPPRKDDGSIDYSHDFFGDKAFLTVSGQLNGEAMALSYGQIYTFGPTFRAENSNTTRHLSEFWMIEPEVAFANLRDNMLLAEEFLTFIFSKIVERAPDELAFLAKQYKTISIEDFEKLAKSPFAKISYTQAIEELKKSNKKFEYPAEWGNDLQTEHERFLCDQVFKSPVIVTDYPKEIKPFYMRLNSDDKTVAAMDVLVPRVGEIIGGSQREDRYDLLKSRMEAQGLSFDKLQWYLDLRKFGGTPHAGFGVGFERLVQYITGMTNIRDVIAFPRTPQSIDF